MLTVVIGGARSGKSAIAVRLGHRADAAGTTITYLATSPRIDGDHDLDERIKAHQAERPAHWHTIEEQLDLAQAIGAAQPGLVIVDCLTLWTSNTMFHGWDEPTVLDATHRAITAAADRYPDDTIVITNEVGLGIVPSDSLTRAYRDTHGRVNQHWSVAADQVFLAVAGRFLPLQTLDQAFGPTDTPIE